MSAYSLKVRHETKRPYSTDVYALNRVKAQAQTVVEDWQKGRSLEWSLGTLALLIQVCDGEKQ
jgi:hypothetical protein